MKTGTVKTVKITSVIIELGIDFQANDLENDGMGGRVVKKETLESIVRRNFNSINCPRIINYGYYDKETKTQRISVEEDLFV